MNDLKIRLELLNQIKDLETKLAQVLEYSEEGIISCDKDGIMLLFNQGSEKLFGYKKEEVLGKKLDMLIPPRFHANHGKLFGDFAKGETHAKPMGQRSNIYGLRKNGTEFIGQASISNIKTEESHVLTVFVRDVTLQVKYREELKKSEDKLASIIKIAEDAIISVNSDQKIVIFNRGAEKVFGYSAEEAIGMDLNKLIPKEFRHSHGGHIKEFGKLKNHAKMMGERMEIFGLRKDGIEFHAEASISSIEVNDEQLFTVILRDISDKKLLENQLMENVSRLEKINQSKDKYFSIIAHDLKSPLGGLHGYIQMLEEDFTNLSQNEIKEIIHRLKNISTNIYDLLDNLLDWSRLQLNKLSTKIEVIKIKPILEKSVNIFQDAAKLKSVQIQINANDEAEVKADGDMIFTVVRNLISNAVKFSNADCKIEVGTKQGSGVWIVYVKDYGVGIPPEILEKLFRTDSDKVRLGTNNENGNGFGLMLCKELIEKNEGYISVESSLGEGTTIQFALPRA